MPLHNYLIGIISIVPKRVCTNRIGVAYTGHCYKFDLYMDIKDAKTNKNEAVKAFDVKGIPTKFIIDGKCNILFKVVCFSGSDDTAVAEMSTMIDIARKSSPLGNKLM